MDAATSGPGIEAESHHEVRSWLTGLTVSSYEGILMGHAPVPFSFLQSPRPAACHSLPQPAGTCRSYGVVERGGRALWNCAG